jgi:hypothetical protein
MGRDSRIAGVKPPANQSAVKPAHSTPVNAHSTPVNAHSTPVNAHSTPVSAHSTSLQVLMEPAHRHGKQHDPERVEGEELVGEDGDAVAL